MSVKTSKGLFAAVLSKLDEDKKLEESASENLNSGEQSSPKNKTENLVEQGQSSDKSELRSNSPHLLKVAAGVKQMQERSKLAEDLLRSGSQIVEIDPNKIHPSKIKDRLDSAYDEGEIAEITASMRERGQIVPGLVRIIDGKSDEFEIVYGRRRLLAAKRLGIAFKAAIRDLSDEEAIIFQGEENTARNDLSFIEKCLFAKAQEEAGFKREIICASLSTGKSHISEMIKLARHLPLPLLEIIGKAPSIGRGRWEELAALLASMTDDDLESQLSIIITKTVAEQDFNALSSDAKFAAIFEKLSANLSLTDQIPTKNRQKSRNNKAKITKRKWQSPDQNIEITLQKSSSNVVFTLKPKQQNQNNQNTFDIGAQNSLTAHNATDNISTQSRFDMAFDGFAEFLSSRLDALYSDYQQAAKTKKQGDQ